MKKLVFLAAACTVAIVAEAEVRLAPVFGDKMVLQREMPVRVWGFADPRETVTVRFADQKKTVIAEDDCIATVISAPIPRPLIGLSVAFLSSDSSLPPAVFLSESDKTFIPKRKKARPRETVPSLLPGIGKNRSCC